MTRIAITGYASLDHVAVLDGTPRAGRTTTIVSRPTDAWPRLGGSPAYVAAALVDSGISDALPVSWIGDDEPGRSYQAQLEARGVATDGLHVVAGARTPVAVLAYEPDGGCICLYHPGMPPGLSLADRQRTLIAHADWVCVTIGPPEATDAVLDAMRPDARLAWIVKGDPRAMSAARAARLAARADLICHSHAEGSFLAEILGDGGHQRQDQVRIETRGAGGAALTRGGRTTAVATTPVTMRDPTGAGDTFAGGVLAALAQGQSDPTAIVDAGHRAARRLLEARRAHETEG
ncbi:MAG TPA: carbohydrate kinase family protein [Vineibacter sp.]|nr:carbohydrate kinase family protein [Vineibacter sp.]